MNYIVLDLEWNQSSTPEESNPLLTFEIVEIGAIKLNNERAMIGEFSRLVKPQVYKEMHHVTRKLIHLQIEELEKGDTFPEVAKDFLEWCKDDNMYCTWGPLDLCELQNNLRFHGMELLKEGPIPYYDVQKLFSMAFEDGKSRRSLEYAVDFLKIEKDIPFHRAFSDAYYTAKVFAKIREEDVLKFISFDTYLAPAKKEDEIEIDFGKYTKHIFRQFGTKTDVLNDKEVLSMKCPVCHRGTIRKIKWFTPNHKNFYAVSFCPRHGFVKAKVRLRKDADDKFFVIKTMRPIEKATMLEIQEKYNKMVAAKKKAKAKNKTK